MQSEQCINGKILFVDDEINILSSMKRLFRREGYGIFTAESGKDGLEILENNDIDVIVSDMRMPEMSGAEFLAIAYQKWPDTTRILLTGFSDVTATIDAINKGKIYCYISKPWEDEQLKVTVSNALRSRFLEQERVRLEKLTQEQNEELKALNSSLEAKVLERTKELANQTERVEQAYTKLQGTYENTVKVFANLIEMCEKDSHKLSRKIADFVREFCGELNMSSEDVQTAYFAALLLNIGKITLAEDLLNKSYYLMSKQEIEIFQEHPHLAEIALSALDDMSAVSHIISQHKEQIDGNGYPEGLKEADIHDSAKILHIVSDYVELQAGLIVTSKLSFAETVDYLCQRSGTVYDEKYLEAFVAFMKTYNSNKVSEVEKSLQAQDLVPSMVLTRDLHAPNNLLLLAKDSILNAKSIKCIREYEQKYNEVITAHVLVKETEQQVRV